MFSMHSFRIVSLFMIAFVLFASAFISVSEAAAQGSVANDVGNGGRHAIQGRIYVASGRRSEIAGLKVRLVNISVGELELIADGTGTFVFRNLVPGTYTVFIDGGETYEDVQERVVIDDPGSSTLSSTILVRGGSRTANVQIYLRPKVVTQGDAAPDVINAKLAAVPKAAAELYEAAQRSIADKNDARAITQLREAVAIHADFSLAWNDLGVLLQKAGESKKALEAFRSAVKFDAASAAANLNLGCALFDAKAYPEAERYLTEALVRNDTSYRGHYYMGLTQVKLGRIDVAEQAFRKAVEVGADRAGLAHYMLGGIYWSVKRYGDAADELELYLKLEPNAKDAAKTRASITELRKKQN